MGRLKQVRPQIGTLAPPVTIARASAPQGSWQRDNPAERKFYHTAAWQRLRMQVLVEAAFTCQWPGCGRIEADTSLLVADHIVPVRVDPTRKWDRANLQCLCRACHDGPKQAAEAMRYGPDPTPRPRWGGG